MYILHKLIGYIKGEVNNTGVRIDKQSNKTADGTIIFNQHNTADQWGECGGLTDGLG
jgi:hypothetical protein